MERLTDRKIAAEMKHNYEGLLAAGMPRDIATERYIKLAEYENIEEMTEACESKPLQWQKSLLYNFLKKR